MISLYFPRISEEKHNCTWSSSKKYGLDEEKLENIEEKHNSTWSSIKKYGMDEEKLEKLDLLFGVEDLLKVTALYLKIGGLMYVCV